MNIYSMLLGAGAAIGLARVARVTPLEERLSGLLTALVLQAVALVGARIGYVSEHFSYYSSHGLEAIQIWQGGFTWQGAVLAAIIGLVLISLILRKPILPLLDQMSLMILPIAALVWAGCWTEGIAYGITVPGGAWWGVPAVDGAGRVLLRAPVQLLAAISTVFFLGVLESALVKVKRLGIRGGLAGLVFSLNMLAFTFLRADPAPSLLGLRLETWYAILIAGIFFFADLAILIVSKPERAVAPAFSKTTSGEETR